MNECGPSKHSVATGTAPKEEERVDYQSEEFLARALAAEARVREQATAIGSACSYFSALLTAARIVGDGHPITVGKDGKFMALVSSGHHQPFHPLFEELMDVIKERQDPGDPDPAVAPTLDVVGEAIGYLSDIILALGLYDGFFLRATNKELVLRDRAQSRLDLRAIIDKEVLPAIRRDRARRVELEERGEPDLLTPLGVSRQILEFRGHLEHLDRRVQALEDKLKE
jgi:hypothetical protein